MVNLQDRIARGLSRAGIDFSSHQVQALELYCGEILLWNPKLGLVELRGSAREQLEDELLNRHIFDCLAAGWVFQNLLQGLPRAGNDARTRRTIADLGSGAGFPGIPLAVLFTDAPGVDITLIERSGRRCGFLRNCSALLGSEKYGVSFEVREQAMEDQAKNSFTLVTNRAFRPLTPEVFNTQAQLVETGGYLVLYKGRLETIQEEARDLGMPVSISELPPGGLQVVPIPDQPGERHMVIWQNSSL